MSRRANPADGTPATSRLRVLKAAVLLVYRASPGEFVAMVALQGVAALAAVGAVLAGGLVVDRLIGIPEGAGRGALLAPLGLFLAATFVAMVAGAVGAERRRILGELTQRHAIHQVLASVVRSELIRYDEPGFHDRMMRAYTNAGSRPLQVVTGLLGLVSATVTIVGLAVTLLVISPPVLGVVLAAFVPLWWTARTSTRLFYEFAKAETERDRLRTYLTSALMMRPVAAEVRTFELGDPLRARIRGLHDLRIDRLRRLVRTRTTLGVVAALVSVGIAGLVLWVVAGLVADGSLGLDQAAIAAGALLVMAQRLQTLTSSASSIMESALFMEDVESFAAEQPPAGDGRPAEPIDSVSLEGVSFTYPAGTRPAIRDVNLELERGRLVALVGENGSGKTTLARIIAHLYEPTEGNRRVNGAALPDPRAARARISVVHQEFIRFLMSAGDNIAMGRLDTDPDPGRIEEAGRFSGIHDAISRLRQGYDTVLGPEYTGGQELSGGQWQRLAVARAWFRDADVIVLDEPTSSLDPQAEVELIDRIRELADDKLVILVSHRFGTVARADEIVVLSDGRIVEHGSHPDLIAANGLYASMYAIQASVFR